MTRLSGPALITALACLFCPLGASAISDVAVNVNGHHFRLFVPDDATVQFVTERPRKDDKKIKLCVPAAFTDAYQHIDGLAIAGGKTVSSAVDKQFGGACVFIDGDSEIFPTNGGTLLTDAVIKSIEAKHGSLFQQFQLVNDGVPSTFRDKSLFQRRAWVAYRDGVHALLESREALTLTQFAKDLADLDVLNAIYTDMGDWDEGWYRDDDNHIQVLGTSRKATDKQTSWLVFTEPVAHAGSSDSPARAWLQQHWTPSAVQPTDPPIAEWNRAILYSQFPLPRLSSGYRIVPMFRGRYESKDKTIRASIRNLSYGLIDGRPGAVTFTGWSTGGSGYWEVLTLYRIKAGRIQPVGQHQLEDRAVLNKLAVQNNAVVLDWNKHGPYDPATDATVHEVIRLHSKDFAPIVQTDRD
jgi:hypothetical protein